MIVYGNFAKLRFDSLLMFCELRDLFPDSLGKSLYLYPEEAFIDYVGDQRMIYIPTILLDDSPVPLSEARKTLVPIQALELSGSLKMELMGIFKGEISEEDIFENGLNFPHKWVS